MLEISKRPKQFLGTKARSITIKIDNSLILVLVHVLDVLAALVAFSALTVSLALVVLGVHVVLVALDAAEAIVAEAVEPINIHRKRAHAQVDVWAILHDKT
jgi:hypothetical protein